MEKILRMLFLKNGEKPQEMLPVLVDLGRSIKTATVVFKIIMCTI
jgi:hypothetical protein